MVLALFRLVRRARLAICAFRCYNRVYEKDGSGIEIGNERVMNAPLQMTNSPAVTQEQLQEQILERLLRFALMGVPETQICHALGLDKERVQMLLQSAAFQARMIAAIEATSSESKTINDAWQALEGDALDNLLQHMKRNNDPEFALKVAATANKAMRRGVGDSRVINPVSGAMQAVINLPAIFVEKLQMIADNPQNLNFQIGGRLNAQAKRQDAMPASEVTTLFQQMQRSAVN